MATRGKGMTATSRRTAEVVGVVHPLGAGGGQGGKETLWTLRFSFAAWRRKGEPVDERELLVKLPGLTHEKLRVRMEAIHPYDVLRVRMRFEDRLDAHGRLQGELTRLLGPDNTDAELTDVADRLRQPVTVEHPVLGTFTLNRAVDWWETPTTWNAQTVQLYVNREAGEGEPELFGTAEALWSQQKKWDKRVRDFAAKELLDLKNGTWLGEDEKEFTPVRFKARMALQSVAVSAGGRFEFTFEDGDLFWGHAIQVSGTLAEGPTNAGIAG